MVRAMQAVTGPGRVIAGRYELLGQIGQGAMGTVWRARDLVLTREVAIKEVRLPDLMPDQDRKVLRERTLREARVSAKLNHPGVVTVYDVIEAGGTPWIVMELVAARSLEQVLTHDGPLPARQVARIGVMLLGALASAHAAGIVHRDVKPGNVLITGDSRAVLTDFGIATLDGDPGLTQAGMVMGTPGFCAPERIRGAPASPASDLWSLGATLYAAVTGRGPFEGHGSPMAVLASIVHSDPPQLPAAGQLGMVIGSLMSKEPDRRPDATCAIGLLTDVAAGNCETMLTRSPYLGGTRPATLASAADSTDPVGFRAGPFQAGPFPAGPRGTGSPASAGPRVPASPPAPALGVRASGAPAPVVPAPVVPAPVVPAPGGTIQFPAGTGPDSGPPAEAVIPPVAAAGDLTTQTTPARTGRPAGPVPANLAEVPFPDGVGDVRFPVGAGAAVPTWARSGWSGTPAAAGPAGVPDHPAAVALARPGVSGAGQAGQSHQPAPPGQPVPVGQPATAGQPGQSRQPAPPGQPVRPPVPGPRDTRPQPPRSSRSWVLILSLAGAAIVLVGLAAGVLFARASGHGQRATGGTGGSSPTAGALPAGYHWYSQPSAAGTAAGFAMAVPDGWQGSKQATATTVRDTVTGGTITASFTPFLAAGPVREAQALELAAVSRSTYPGYRRIAITPWLVRSRLAGAWRFSYRQPGTGLIEGLEVVSDLPSAGGLQPYQLRVTAPAANWPASRVAFAEALRTLRADR
jgi:eukaryotic-like serine/threonine-protein kinase